MKTFLGSLALVTTLFSTNAFAYELAGDLTVNWTGYKTNNKVGVGGSFDKVEVSASKNADFASFLKGMSVSIDSYSLNSKNKFRDKNILTLFKTTEAKAITAKVLSIKGDATKGELIANISMNNTTKEVVMPYMLQGGKLSAKGEIDILDFMLKEGFEVFSKKCKAFHAGKTWSSVDISFEVPVK